MTTDTMIKTITVAALPALHAALADGKFAGVITLQDGTHHAVVLLDARPEKRLNWANAKAWAKEVGGQLPSRAIAALLYATCRTLVPVDWYWTDESEGSSYAWYCDFYYGGIDYDFRSSEGGAAAVRLIPLTA